jgi:hypothetical protein
MSPSRARDAARVRRTGDACSCAGAAAAVVEARGRGQRAAVRVRERDRGGRVRRDHARHRRQRSARPRPHPHQPAGRGREPGASGNPVAADWTTGAVGMTGVSYNGRLRSSGPRAVSSAGQSTCLTSRRSRVRAAHRPFTEGPAMAGSSLYRGRPASRASAVYGNDLETSAAASGVCLPPGRPRSAGFCLPSYLPHERSGPGAVKPSASAPSAASCEAVGLTVAGSRSYAVSELVGVDVMLSTSPAWSWWWVGVGEDASEASARSRRRRGRRPRP